jgi:hypothetical protein
MKIIIRTPSSDRDLNMTPDGQFVDPPAPSLSARILRAAILLAVLAGMIGLAALALWFALILIPIAIGAALVAWAAFRFRLWRMRQR